MKRVSSRKIVHSFRIWSNVNTFNNNNNNANKHNNNNHSDDYIWYTTTI